MTAAEDDRADWRYEAIMDDREERRHERYLDRMDARYGRIEDWRRPAPKPTEQEES